MSEAVRRRAFRGARGRVSWAVCSLGGTLAGLAIAGCSSDSSRPPTNDEGDGGPPGFDGSSSDSPGQGEDGGYSSTGDGAQGDAAIEPTDAPTDASSGDSSSLADSALADVQITPPSDAAMVFPICDPNTTWGTPTNVPGVPTFATSDPPFVTVTANGQTAAWVTDAGGGQGSVFVADRADETSAFGAANQLIDTEVGDAAVDFFPYARVALSGDGTTLVSASLDGTKFAQFFRIDRTVPLSGSPNPHRYELLSGSVMLGDRLGNPVLSDDGEDLIYSKFSHSAPVTIYESFTTAMNQWPGGVAQAGQPLLSSGGDAMQPTGFSEDRLTLFVWDPASSMTVPVIRGSDTSYFTAGGLAIPYYSVQADTTCTRLYFVGGSSGSYSLEQVYAVQPSEQ